MCSSSLHPLPPPLPLHFAVGCIACSASFTRHCRGCCQPIESDSEAMPPHKRLRAVRMLVHLLLIERTLFGSFAASKTPTPSPLQALQICCLHWHYTYILRENYYKRFDKSQNISLQSKQINWGEGVKRRGEIEREGRRIYANCE